MSKHLFSRIKNLVASEWNYLLSRMGMVRCNHYPTFVSIEPANFCPLHCPACPVGRKGKDEKHHTMLSMETYRTILEKLSPYVHTIQFYFQGEPLLNRQLPKMIALAKQEGLYTSISTNAQVINSLLADQLVVSGLDHIIVSIDGLSEESYRAYRQGGSLHKALEGLCHIRQAKQKHNAHIRIELQCLRLKSNEHEWQHFKRTYRHMGADSLTLKTAQFYDYEHGNDLMPSNSKYSRYTFDVKSGCYRPKNRYKSLKDVPCRRLWKGCVIDVHGNMFPCCFDKEGQYSFGNLVQSSLDDVWFSNQALLFRQSVTQDRMQYNICTNCTE